METSTMELGNGALVIMGVYLLVMLALGWMGKRSRREESLRDFYLGGSSFGLAVLFLTLFATQYSGNTLLGFAGRSYQAGGAYVVSITFMVLVITTFMIYAPRMFRLARKFGYITPADYVFHRFGSHALRIFAVVLLCWGLGNYILENLVAMGHAVEAISNERIPFMAGVVMLVGVMLVYESLGGMRSVAWTDAVQGTLIFIGCLCILYILLTAEGGLSAASAEIMSRSDEFGAAKLQVPAAPGIRTWVSNLILLGLGVAIYPHAIQRIFAARNLKTLRRSLSLMAFMPLATTLLAFLIGIVGLARFPGLSQLESDKITIMVLASMGESAFIYWLVVIVFSAVVAAIMSTADSALLSIGSMVTKDIYEVYIRPGQSQTHYLKVGKLFGWGLMAVLVFFAWVSLETESSIWLLIKLKLEFMVQLVPTIVLGIFWKRLGAKPVLAGMIVGTAITLVIWGGVMFDLWGSRSPWGVSAGVWGLAANVSISIIGALLAPEPVEGPEASEAAL